MIKIIKWTCPACDDKLFLRVDDSNEKDKARLLKFETYATKHVLSKGHEMIRKEKEEKGVKYV